MNLEIKALHAASTVWTLRPEHHVSADDIAMTVHLTTGATVSQTFTALSADALTVTAVSSDRRTLTLDALTPAPSGLVGEGSGHAHWHDGQLGEVSLRIRERVSATSIILADPLPGRATTGTIRPSTYTTTLTNASGVTATVGRCLFDLTYGYDLSGSMPAQQKRASGVIYVVKHVFATGLTTDSLVDFDPRLRSRQAVQQGSAERAIEASERVLWRWIRQDLKGRAEGYRTEDSLSGSALHEVHALLALAHIARYTARDGGRDDANDLETRARELYERVMQSIPWLDGDGDAVVDEGEGDAPARGPVATVGGLYTSSDFTDADGVSYTPRFRVGASH